MKPTWDRLVGEYEFSHSVIAASVDCTMYGGEQLCHQYGVHGYPTIKYGDPDALQEYMGGRSFEELKEFADATLVPTCGPDYIEMCDEKTKQQIQQYLAMEPDELQAEIESKEAEYENIEAEYKKETQTLRREMEILREEYDANETAIYPELRMMEIVFEHKKHGHADEL